MEDLSLLRAFLSLAFVLGLVVAMGWGLRRWDSSRIAARWQQGRRLRVLEQCHLDAKRKLVLFACDEHEYLVMLGAGETVIQSSVVSHQSSVKKEANDA